MTRGVEKEWDFFTSRVREALTTLEVGRDANLACLLEVSIFPSSLLHSCQGYYVLLIFHWHTINSEG